MNKVSKKESKKNAVKKVNKAINIDSLIERTTEHVKKALSDIKTVAVNMQKVNEAKNQATAIQFMLLLNMKADKIAKKLVELKLCENEKKALARIKRHIKHDEQQRVVKRSVATATK